MTPSPPVRPDNLLNLLFGVDGNVPDSLASSGLAGAVEDNLATALKTLPHALRAAAVAEGTAVAAQALDVNLAELLIAGWRDYEQLTSAAHRTLSTGKSELISLATHQITASLTPSITLLIDNHRVAKLQLEVSAVCDIKALVAKIRAGRLVAMYAGYSDTTATLAVQNTEIVSKTSRFDLPGLLSFNPGIRLLPVGEYRSADDRTQILNTSSN